MSPDALRAALVDWFRRERRELPWRGAADPYAIWVSEIMLQQTQVATVIPYFERFLSELPTVLDLARAPLERVLQLWAGLGYYARARNLHAAAGIIVARHGGRFPADPRAARKLPGIGEYAAGAILSLAFGARLPAVDVNAERVLCRVLALEGLPRRAPTRGLIRAAAQALADCDAPGDVNQALFELGATVCRPAGPHCHRCPVAGLCLARARGRQEELPRATPRAARVQRRTVAVVVRRRQEVLLARRAPEGVWGGLWEFPQAELAGGEEDAARTAQAHVRRALGLRVQVGPRLMQLRHGIMNQAVTLQVYEAQARGGALRPAGYAEARWAPAGELEGYAMSAPHRRIARSLVS